MTDTQLRLAQIMRGVREIITEPKPRDKQVRIGPSDMAQDCLYCLGCKMAGEKVGRWSMFPWLGSAMHVMIEWTRDHLTLRKGHNEMAWALFGEDRAEFEKRVLVCEIPGYGQVWGSIDVFLKTLMMILDWKSTSKKKLRVYQTNGVPANYIGQLTMYMHALRLLGYNVEEGVLVFIPRDTHTEDDIWGYPVKYTEANALNLIQRCAQVYEWVKINRHHELPKHPDCFNCFPRYFG